MAAMEKSGIVYEFGLASDLFWDPLGEDEIRAVAEHGFSFLEIWGHMPWFDVYSATMASEIRAMTEAHGLRVRSVHAPCEGDWDISSDDGDIRRKSVKEVILATKRCREMGGELVVVHPGRRINSEGPAAEAEHDRRLQTSIESFVEIIEAAGENGVLIAVENQWANEVGGTEKHFVRLLDTLDPQVAGVCFDSSHANITPGSLEMIGRISHPIITTHLSDNHGKYDEHKPPFAATIDWSRTLNLLLEKGFCGPWLMEVTNGGNDPLTVLAGMRESISRMRTALKKLSCNG